MEVKNSTLLYTPNIANKSEYACNKSVFNLHRFYNTKDCFAKTANNKTISFGRNKEEHESWGAVYNEQTGQTAFKVFSFPENEVFNLTEYQNGEPKKIDYKFNKVELLVYKGDEIPKVSDGESGIPEGAKVYQLKEPEISKAYPKRTPHSPGVYSAIVNDAKPGDKYCYRVNATRVENGEEKTFLVPDPYSFKQPGVSTWSVIYDKAYKKEVDENWKKNPARIVRDERIDQLKKEIGVKFTPFSAANIYEAHIGTLTEEGTFDAAMKKDAEGKTPIQRIKEGGFNTIEVMPLEGTHSFNWGYDGVNKFAVRNDYGGPDKAREFIKHCHDNGVSVIIDFVPNHVGPDGNYLSYIGKYAGVNDNEKTQWGDKFHLENGENRYQKDFVSNMALNWLRMGADGIRADMTSQMGSDRQIKQITAEVNEHFPDAFLIAEDPRRDEKITNIFVEPHHYNGDHDKFIEEIMSVKDDPDLTHLGFNSRWGFKLHHNIAGALIRRWEPCINDKYFLNVESLHDFSVKEAGRGVLKYLMSHDEAGNHNGIRLIPKIVSERLVPREKIEHEYGAGKEYQIGEQIAHRLCFAQATIDKDGLVPVVEGEKVVKKRMWGDDGALTGEFTTAIEKELKNFLIYKEFKVDWQHPDFKKERFVEVFEEAQKLHLVGNGMIFAVPGPVMSLQGNENMDLTPFRFAREFEFDTEDNGVKNEKGYDTGKIALIDSKLSTYADKYDQEYKAKMQGAGKFYKKLSEIFSENPALQNGYIERNKHRCRTNYESHVLATHAKKDDNEIFSIAHFGDREFGPNDKYGMRFPAGKWQLIITSDDQKYGGEGKIENPDNIIINSGDGEKKFIEIPAKSFMMFKKVG